jgi:lipoprotein-releasing system permease protein
MRFELTLARRYLRSPGRGLAKTTARLAVAGIAFGVAAMIFALALSRGFREEVQENLVANMAHISIGGLDDKGIENIDEIKKDLSDIDGIKSVAAASNEGALLVTAQANTYAVLRAREEIPREHKQGCIAASFGSELADRMVLSPGASVEVIFGVPPRDPGEDGSAKKVCLFVKDTFTTGLYEYDSTQIKLSLADLMHETELPPKTIEVSVNDIYSSKKIAEKIREKLGTFYVVLDWQEANKPLFAAMSFERQIVVTIISLVVLLSALNITFTLAIGVTQRRRDIGILRAAGAKGPNIVLMFMLEGFCLGGAGILAGVVLGLAACFLANYFNLISLPPDVYVLNKISLRVDPLDIVFVVLFAVLLTVAAVIYPAFSAARVKPWETLRQ